MMFILLVGFELVEGRFRKGWLIDGRWLMVDGTGRKGMERGRGGEGTYGTI